MKDEFLEKARRALNKRSKYGLDVDVSKYVPVEPNMNELSSLKEISPELEKVLRKVGIDVEEEKRIGSYLQVDQKSIYSWSSHPGVEVLSLSEAVQLDWFKEYFWNAVPADLDKYTALTAIYGGEGYVIRVKKNVKVDMPVQACLIVKGRRELQTPHNIIIAEEGSRLHVVTGCTVAPESFGLHTGISEFY
ncbi:MAG TPA: SufD family Fe-S cluster assembly protein, partial [Candidatus Bathyarchaeota archaeon]|nr:SufD family Fe-S cluster assembly protein [Candidatus Bathyarchaeota archaeon]